MQALNKMTAKCKKNGVNEQIRYIVRIFAPLLKALAHENIFLHFTTTTCLGILANH